MDVPIKCVCGQHDTDTITIPDVLDFRRSLTVRQYIRLGARDEGLSLAETVGVLLEAYVLHCIDAWTLTDKDGKAIPVTKQAVRTYLLPNLDEAEKVGDAADELYTEKVVLPLLAGASISSGDSPTGTSTPPTNTNGSKRPKPSKPSSTSTTPMAVTGPMAASPAGVSNSSLS